MLAAIVHHAALIGVDIFIDQELLFQPRRDVLPRQYFSGRTRPPGIPVHVQAKIGKGLLPGGEIKIFAPALQFGAQLPCTLNHVTDPPVTPGQEGFDQCLLGIVPGKVYAWPTQLLLQQLDLRPDHAFFFHWHPLEGCMGLGYQCADTNAHVGLFAQHALAHGQHLFGQIGNRLHIFERLRRVANHKVHLDRRPPALIDFLRRTQQILRRNRFVDYITQPVGGGLWRKGEARATPPFLQQVH